MPRRRSSLPDFDAPCVLQERLRGLCGRRIPAYQAAQALTTRIGGILDGRVATAKEDIVQPDQHRIWPRRHEGKLPACTVCRIGNGRDARLVEVG